MTDRRELVKVLRASARTHGVAQVRDDACTDKVMQMVTALRAKSLERDDKKALEDTVEKYLQTFSDGQAAVAQGRLRTVTACGDAVSSLLLRKKLRSMDLSRVEVVLNRVVLNTVGFFLTRCFLFRVSSMVDISLRHSFG